MAAQLTIQLIGASGTPQPGSNNAANTAQQAGSLTPGLGKPAATTVIGPPNTVVNPPGNAATPAQEKQKPGPNYASQLAQAGQSAATIAQGIGSAGGAQAAAGAAGLVGALAPIAAAAGPVGVGFALATTAVTAFGLATMGISNAIDDYTKQIAKYSEVLSVQQAQFDIIRLQRDINRAQTMGPQLAAHAQARFDLEQKFQDLVDRLMPTLLTVSTEILKAIASYIDGFDEALITLLDLLQQIYNAVTLGLGPNSQFFADVVQTMRNDLRERQQARNQANQNGLEVWIDQLFGANADRGNERQRAADQLDAARGGNGMPLAPAFGGF